MKLQKFRRILILVSFLLFPVTIWYFSPYLIVQAAAQRIINGSLIVFACMFVFSLFFSRVWCGYLCPAGGLQECAARANDVPAKQGRRRAIKFVLWALMVCAVIALFIRGTGSARVDFFYMTDHGISVTGIYNYVIYYAVILLLLVPALIHGRRAACHYICWMAPFMILGGKIGRLLHLPQLHMTRKEGKCVSCEKCNKACPMGLNVAEMVKTNSFGKCPDCIQCGACRDTCPNKVIGYAMKWEK